MLSEAQLVAIAGWAYTSHGNQLAMRNVAEPIPQFIMASTRVDGDVAHAARAVRAGVDLLGKKLIRSWLFEMIILGCYATPGLLRIDPHREVDTFKRMVRVKDNYKTPIKRDWDVREAGPGGTVNLPASTIPLYVAIGITSRAQHWDATHDDTVSYLTLAGLSQVVDGQYQSVAPNEMRLRR